VLHYNAGAFRHGFIEIVEPGCGVVIITSPQPTASQAYTLARDLQNYGARLLLVENGLLRQPDEPGAQVEPVDEFLSPMVDIVPFQIYADALATQLGFGKGFRYISKVVTQL
jgi:fructoselysine-6-P-deglycase FrlB-like protein